MPLGGARPGSGPKKGSHNRATVSKVEAREIVRQVIMRDAEEMTAAQIAAAKGLKYLVTRDAKTGKFVRVTQSTLDSIETLVEVWEKDPSTAAYTDLMNRALDKPKEQEQEIKVTGDEVRFALLLAGRQRAREGR